MTPWVQILLVTFCPHRQMRLERNMAEPYWSKLRLKLRSKQNLDVQRLTEVWAEGGCRPVGRGGHRPSVGHVVAAGAGQFVDDLEGAKQALWANCADILQEFHQAWPVQSWLCHLHAHPGQSFDTDTALGWILPSLRHLPAGNWGNYAFRSFGAGDGGDNKWHGGKKVPAAVPVVLTQGTAKAKCAGLSPKLWSGRGSCHPRLGRSTADASGECSSGEFSSSFGPQTSDKWQVRWRLLGPVRSFKRRLWWS